MHATPESAWLSLNGVIYDVSTYAHYHPGGKIILKGAGKDATGLFSKNMFMKISTILGSMGSICFKIMRWATCQNIDLL